MASQDDNHDSLTLPPMPAGIPTFEVVEKEVCCYVLWSPAGPRFSFHKADATELGAFAYHAGKWTFEGAVDVCALAFVDFVADNLPKPK